MTMKTALLLMFCACATEPVEQTDGGIVLVGPGETAPRTENIPPPDAYSCPGVDPTTAGCCDYLVAGCSFPTGVCQVPQGASCEKIMCGPDPSEWYEVCR